MIKREILINKYSNYKKPANFTSLFGQNSASSFMKQLFLYSFIVLLHFCFGQKEANHWVLARGYHVDFNTWPPVVTRELDTNTYSCSSISDTAGNFLFYTNGETVWNADGSIAENGTNMGSWDGSEQHTAIVPIPYSDLYYIITTHSDIKFSSEGAITKWQDITPLAYSLVQYKDGHATVLEKNIQLWDDAIQSFDVTPHANGDDIWLTSIDDNTFSDSLFIAFRLTSCGVKDTIISPTMNTNPYFFKNTIKKHKSETMSFSPNGKWLVHDQYIYRFDASIGKFSFNHQYGEVQTPHRRMEFSWDQNSRMVLGVNTHPQNIYGNELDIYDPFVKSYLCQKPYNNYDAIDNDYQLGPRGYWYYADDRLPYGLKYIKPESFCSEPRSFTIATQAEKFAVVPNVSSYFYDPNYKSPPNRYPTKLEAIRVCLGDSTNFILSADNNTVIQYVVLGNGDTIQPTTHHFSYLYQEAGQYTGYAITERRCVTQNVPFNVVVDEQPQLDLAPEYNYFHCGERGIDFVIDSVFNTAILWNDGNDAFTRKIPAGDWEVTVTNTCGSLTEQFEVIELFITEIPNIVTPNGDGLNDVLVVENIPPDANLQIMNRWGKTIFEINNYTNNWPNSDVTPGVYYYNLTALDCIYTGWVQVLY